MTPAERRRFAAALESRLADLRNAPRRTTSTRLDDLDAALKLHCIRELGKFDAGQFAAVNR